MWYISYFDRINKIWFTNACVNNVKHYEKVKTHSDIENTETKNVWKTGYLQIFDFDDRYIFNTCALL